MTPTVLSIAGSDSGGGAGIQADIKAISACGAYAATAITAITAQNTKMVTAIQEVSPEVITAQIQTVLMDINVQALKIGMLGTHSIIQTVAEAITVFQGSIVLDPVMIAKSGDSLLAEDAIESLRTALLPRATILTPNLPEAAKLLNTQIAETKETILAQGAALCKLGPRAVLMKGGHAKGKICQDYLLLDGKIIGEYQAERLHTRNTHGTGCTLSAAIAAELAKGEDLETSVKNAHRYLQGAIKHADSLNIGEGHGPVHHFHHIWSA